MSDMNQSNVKPESPQPTAAELRAQAEAIEAEHAAMNRGKVFISQYSGMAAIHDGTGTDEFVLVQGWREASEAEVQALLSIPEFASRLDRVRGGK